jgi:putative resolvase
MDGNRKGFQEIIQLIIKGEVELLVVENKDRLTRFGFDTLENIFKYFGTKILVLNDSLDNKTYEQELSEDLISIIHYFTMKSYSHRRKLNKIRKELEEEQNNEYKNNQATLSNKK